MPARQVVVAQVDRKRTTYATSEAKSPKGYSYPVFTISDKAQAKRYTERQALTMLDKWRSHNLAAAGKCNIEPAQ